MNRIVLCTAVAAVTWMAAGAQTPAPAPAATPAQAEKLVKTAVAYATKNGMDKLIDQTNQGNGIFHVGSGSQLYIFIYDQAGLCKAIGFGTANFVGKNRIELKDPDGKMILKEFIKSAKANPAGSWVDYKYPNPLNGKNEPKTSFIMLHEGLIIGAGSYK